MFVAIHASDRACAEVYFSLLTQIVKDLNYENNSRNMLCLVFHATCYPVSSTTCFGVSLDIMTVMFVCLCLDSEVLCLRKIQIDIPKDITHIKTIP